MTAPRDPAKTVDERVAKWFAMGDRLYRSGSEPMALSYYQWITEVAPRNARAWRMLGLCALTGLGGEAAALEALQRAVELDPSDAQARAALDNLQRKLGAVHIIDQGQRQFTNCWRRSSSAPRSGSRTAGNRPRRRRPPSRTSRHPRSRRGTLETTNRDVHRHGLLQRGGVRPGR